MKTLSLFLGMALSMCSTTHQTSKRHAVSHKGKTTVVDSTWMAMYKAREEQYGYRIEQDAQIKSSGGKYRVPQEVVDHNTDMLKAKP